MAAHASYTELVAMQEKDLHREITSQRGTVRKLRMGVLMQTEKDTALYRREKKQLARMQAAITHVRKIGSTKPTKTLKAAKKSSTVPAPSAS